MTTILAIETSTEVASVALLHGEELCSRTLPDIHTHSQGVLPAVQELLADFGIGLALCDAIAYGCGPGGFTGLRTACGIVQGLAFGAGLPVVPVVSLLAMAEAARGQLPGDECICVLDARMAEWYWAHYRYRDGTWQIVQAPVLSSLDDCVPGVSGQAPAWVLGRGVQLPEHWPGLRLSGCLPHAEQVARLAQREFEFGLSQPAESVQPLYLRNKIALTTAERLLAKGV